MGFFGAIPHYLISRVPTLRPPFDPLPNPIAVLRQLSTLQWLQFSCAFAAWTWDSFDFFSVSLTTTQLGKDFGKSTTDITWGITLVLMLRSVGAVIFGIASDRYGRKWPFVVNNLLFVAFELGTGFCKTYKQFLAVRALFGIAMGGLYGNATAQALEDCPAEARGIVSGMMQQGYAFGYLLATAFARGLVDTTSHGWRPLYWFGACPPVLFIIFRLFLPETEAYQARVALRKSSQEGGNDDLSKTFLSEAKIGLQKHWLVLLYLVLLMAGFNFMSHGSQDLYPTMLRSQYKFSADAVTITQVVSNLGAMCGGTVVGYLSQSVGRRISIIVMSIIGGALLYPYTYIDNERIAAAAFFEQFCVQGAWGVVPIYMMELSPGSLRTFTVGTAYQLGNLASSASSTIESRIGERFPLSASDGGTTDGSGEKRFKYGLVMCIFMGCVFGYVVLLAFLGPEKKGVSFEAEDDEDLVEATGGHKAFETDKAGLEEYEDVDKNGRPRSQERGAMV